eukprot:6209525-Pleurochrysis_carterae.AAC.2
MTLTEAQHLDSAYRGHIQAQCHVHSQKTQRLTMESRRDVGSVARILLLALHTPLPRSRAPALRKDASALISAPTRPPTVLRLAGATPRLGRPLHRPGWRVRLLGLSGDQGAQGGGPRGRAHQPQHRLRADQQGRAGPVARRPRLPAAGHARVRRGRDQARAARGDHPVHGRPDRPQLRHRAREARHPGEVQRPRARHAGRRNRGD